MDEEIPLRLCRKCDTTKPQTTEFFYVARPRGRHKSLGWQAHCKECWKSINAANKLRRKIRVKVA